jgi:hypothetical protein
MYFYNAYVVSKRKQYATSSFTAPNTTEAT